MRILGLDYGSKTVGVAATDELGITVQTVETIFRKEENKLRRTYARIEELIEELNISSIVVGLPLNMDGSESVRSAMCRDFAANVERRTGLPVIMWDERLTTVQAEEILIESGVARQDRKKYIDKIAAQIILEDYVLNSKNKADQAEENGDDHG